LVDLVESSVGGSDEPCGEGPGPMPTVARAADATVEQHIENEIFGEVRGLANEVVDGLKGRIAEGWHEPVQNGTEDTGGMGIREGVGGSDEDDRAP